MIIACLLLIFCSENCENRLVNKVFMICCMTCPWAPTAGGTTAQSGQRNDGVMTPHTKRLTKDSVTSTEYCTQTLINLQHLKKTFNNLHKINVYVFMKNK